MTKVFISWSGEESRLTALALKNFLELMFQQMKVFVSDSDIDAGMGWDDKLNEELKMSVYGIVSLNPDNMNSSWLIYEVGCLSKAPDNKGVAPYLTRLKKNRC